MINKNFAFFGILTVATILGYSTLHKSTPAPTVVTVGFETIKTVPSANSGDNVIRILPTKNEESSTQVLRVTPDKDRVVELYGVVSNFSATSVISKFRKLDSLNKPIYLLINSPGGSVLAGASIVSQMQAMKSPVYTVCTQLCASMAAVISQYGTKRYALDRAVLMFHPASGGAQGQIKNMKSLITFIDSYVEKFNNDIVSRSKVTKDEYDRLTAYELWIDSQDSLKKGFLDNIVSLDLQIDVDPSMPPSDERHNQAIKNLMDVQ